MTCCVHQIDPDIIPFTRMLEVEEDQDYSEEASHIGAGVATTGLRTSRLSDNEQVESFRYAFATVLHFGCAAVLVFGLFYSACLVGKGSKCTVEQHSDITTTHTDPPYQKECSA